MLLTFRQRLVFFICISVFGLAVSGFAGGFIMAKFPMSTPAMRIASVLQSLFQMIIPAVATAMIVTRRPASFLAIDRRIDYPTLVLAIVSLIVATPMMNMVISLNEAFSLPESMKPFEDALRTMETRAGESISLLQGAHTPGNLVMNILIIGVLAGFGEELFFRGTFVRLLTTGHVNRHIAVWTVAVIFSAMHFQFFGFVPRTLLGAYFGYLLVWSRCLWIPVIVHAANNIIYVVSHYASAGMDGGDSFFDRLGTGDDYLVLAISIALTIVSLIMLYRRRVRDRQKD